MYNIPSGWIRLTDIAKEYGKMPNHFYRLNSTKAFIDELESRLETVVIIIFRGGDSTKNGMWAHPLLAEKFIAWVTSPKRARSYRFESCHRNLVAGKFPGSEIEVETEAGYCDVVTNEFAIEIKESRGWKSAIGQAQCYAFCLNRKPAIYLIGQVPDICVKICAELDVTIFHWKE